TRTPKAHGSEHASYRPDPRPLQVSESGRQTGTNGASSRSWRGFGTVSGLEAFAEEVGAEGPVTVVGGRTQWDVGGCVDSSVREVRAPSGIVEFEPAEMTVRCRAGTTVAELDAVLA